MEEHKVKILDIGQVTHNVMRFTVEKPDGYSFVPGQATEVSPAEGPLKDEGHPFTFTGLNGDPDLEFIIKIYPGHEGMTDHLSRLSPGDELIIRDVWGAIQYKGNGAFIAGGAGVTPFIAILRQLNKDGKIKGNKLLFANNTEKDIILKDEFSKILGDDFINILSEEKHDNYEHGLIDKNFLKKHITDFGQHFYVCGPPPFIKAIQKALTELGAKSDTVVIEE